jgi:hypothetical protein
MRNSHRVVVIATIALLTGVIAGSAPPPKLAEPRRGAACCSTRARSTSSRAMGVTGGLAWLVRLAFGAFGLWADWRGTRSRSYWKLV